MYFKAGLIIKKNQIKEIKSNINDIKDYLFFFKNSNNLYLKKNKNILKVLLKKKELFYLYSYFKKKYKIYVKKIIYEKNMIKCIIKVKKNILIKKNNDLKRRKFFSENF
ncbi:hypothetical protein ACWNYQ_00480 [Candidatus Vidania fulgoroideorum]